MGSVSVDLQQGIDEARRRYVEAEDLYDQPLATDPTERERQRDQLMGPLTALDEQIIALKAVRDEKGAAQVVVDDVNPQEVQEINAALAALQRVIRRTETFQANLTLLTAALGAVTTISSAGKRGQPTGAPAPAAFVRVAGPLDEVTAGPARLAARPRYVCWAPHHEDLTRTVEDAFENGGVAVATVAASAAVRPARICVKCSEGHTNVFTVK